MLRIEKIMAGTVATALRKRAALLTLPYEDRCRSRLAATLDDGREAALFLPRGTILRHGAMLVATDGTLVQVAAAPQPVMRVASSDPLLLLRAAYHLGNRHTPVQIEADTLRLEYDPVLRDMLLRLGVQVTEAQEAFDPEAGAYGGGHRHGHDATFEQDQALAQEAYAHRHGHDHAHDHAHGPDCDHDPAHGHSHGHSHDHDHDDHPHDHDHAGGHDHAHGQGHKH
ncbi:MAG: urease accessory protein UreE [Bordetella sp.]|uniref:urease accessory protein UreE n=1 Tax=Bordetella sp. TaxID=28081 RepID=UPI003F7C45AA